MQTTTADTTMTTHDRQRRRAELIASVAAQAETSRLTMLEAIGLAFDMALVEKRAIQAEAKTQAEEDAARRAVRDAGERGGAA